MTKKQFDAMVSESKQFGTGRFSPSQLKLITYTKNKERRISRLMKRIEILCEIIEQERDSRDLHATG